jgi:hypothetical protein
VGFGGEQVQHEVEAEVVGAAAGSAYSIVWSSPARPPIPWLTRAISAAHSGVDALVPPSETFWPRMKTW